MKVIISLFASAKRYLANKLFYNQNILVCSTIKDLLELNCEKIDEIIVIGNYNEKFYESLNKILNVNIPISCSKCDRTNIILKNNEYIHIKNKKLKIQQDTNLSKYV